MLAGELRGQADQRWRAGGAGPSKCSVQLTIESLQGTVVQPSAAIGASDRPAHHRQASARAQAIFGA
jgi:hypothetical protein